MSIPSTVSLGFTWQGAYNYPGSVNVYSVDIKKNEKSSPDLTALIDTKLAAENEQGLNFGSLSTPFPASIEYIKSMAISVRVIMYDAGKYSHWDLPVKIEQLSDLTPGKSYRVRILRENTDVTAKVSEVVSKKMAEKQIETKYAKEFDDKLKPEQMTLKQLEAKRELTMAESYVYDLKKKYQSYCICETVLSEVPNSSEVIEKFEKEMEQVIKKAQEKGINLEDIDQSIVAQKESNLSEADKLKQKLRAYGICYGILIGLKATYEQTRAIWGKRGEVEKEAQKRGIDLRDISIT
jgi:hypothetical protein